MDLAGGGGTAIINAERNPNHLRPWQKNARRHSPKQKRQLIKSMATFGFTSPALIDEAGNILAGHARVEAAKELGLLSIPCRVISGLSEAKKRALVIADNQLGLNSTWDEALLAAEITVIQQEAVIPMEVVGLEPVEIDALIEAEAPSDKDGSSEDDALPGLEEGLPVAEPGDIWICGDHRIICGDSLTNETFVTLLSGERAEMVFADPPYNVPIDGHVSGLGRIKHHEFAMASGEMSQPQFTEFLTTALLRLADHSVDGSIHFLCMDWRHLKEMTAAGEAVYTELKNLIVWDKGTPGMGSFYRSRHELIFAFKNGGAAHINNFGLGQHGRNRSNVWTYRGMASASGNRLKELALHPTVKPVQMIADVMRDCSTRDGIVLDSFGGSGSTMIAAEKTRRRARLIEINPVYVDRTIRRWQTIARDDAIHAVTGETFAERQQARRSNSPAA